MTARAAVFFSFVFFFLASGLGALARVCPNGTVWTPRPNFSWQWQLSGTIDTSVDARMFDIDLFETPQATIDALHSAGRAVICYFCAGSYEPGRPDSSLFPAEALGNTLEGWPDERWVDVRNAAIRSIMLGRLDTAVSKGCDGVEPDNVDGFANSNGLGLTAADQLDFNTWLAKEAHARSLSVGLKNDLGQITSLVGIFDWSLNEECSSYDECDELLPFTARNKTVFGAVYQEDGSFSELCADPNERNFDFLYKNLDLDASGQPCRTATINHFDCVPLNSTNGEGDDDDSDDGDTATALATTSLQFLALLSLFEVLAL